MYWKVLNHRNKEAIMKRTIIAIVILTIMVLHPNPLLLGAAKQKSDVAYKMKLVEFGVPFNKVDQIYAAIKQASTMTHIDMDLIAALMKTESEFNDKAKGGRNKCYFGLMQIPYKIYDIRKNVLIGTFILEEKIKDADGNLKVAIARYKGWRVPKEGEKQANRVLSLYRQLREV